MDNILRRLVKTSSLYKIFPVVCQVENQEKIKRKNQSAEKNEASEEVEKNLKD
jgi:hypothetical protein